MFDSYPDVLKTSDVQRMLHIGKKVSTILFIQSVYTLRKLVKITEFQKNLSSILYNNSNP